MRLFLAMIAKIDGPAARQKLEEALESVRQGVDGAVLVLDSGNSDPQQLDAFEQWAFAGPVPERDERGACARDGFVILRRRWTDDFSAARNVSLELAREAGAEWVLILDADELLATNAALMRHRLNKLVDEGAVRGAHVHVSCVAEDAGEIEQFRSVRFFALLEGVRYEGAAHNQLVGVHPEFVATLDAAIVSDYGTKRERKARAHRTLKILGRMWRESGETDLRAAFYIQKTRYLLGDLKGAFKWAMRVVQSSGEARYAQAWCTLYMAARRLEGPNVAEAILEDAIERHPQCPDIRYLGALNAMERFDMAQAEPGPYAEHPSFSFRFVPAIPIACQVMGWPSRLPPAPPPAPPEAAREEKLDGGRPSGLILP